MDWIGRLGDPPLSPDILSWTGAEELQNDGICIAMIYRFETISVTVDRGVLFATVSNPPCNILSVPMMFELTQLAKVIVDDDEVRVLVLQSDNPDFFIAHFDAQAVIDIPMDQSPERSTNLSALHAMCAGFYENPKPSLVKIAGRAGGGGSELASSCDMRFGVRGKTVLNQMEVPLGILPAGSGTQNLTRLMGRGRALEMILGAADIDADVAASWGYLNRVFSSADEMNEFVDSLAFRIAAWPPYAVGLAKEAVGKANLDWREGLLEEHVLGVRTLQHPEAKRSLRAFLERGGETVEGEMRVADLAHEVADVVRNMTDKRK